MIKIRFFGRLRELLGRDELELEWEQLPQPLDLEQLRQLLVEQHEEWRPWLMDQSLQAAVNQQVACWEQLLGVGDEVAFFPPVTGG